MLPTIGKLCGDSSDYDAIVDGANSRSVREARRRRLVDSIPQMVWLTDVAGSTEHLNPRGVDQIGAPASSACGWDWLQLLHPDDIERARDAWTLAVQSMEPYRCEYRVRQAGGDFRWYLSQGEPLRAPDGEIEGWIGTWSDIHSLKQAEQSLSRDALLLANVRDAVVVTDREGVISYWNKGATELFGWTTEERVGRHLAERLPEAARPEFEQIMQAAAAQGEWTGEFEDYRKDGSRLWISARVAPFTDGTGQPAGLIGVCHDVTHQKQVEAERQRLISVIETSPDFIGIADAGRRVVFINRAGLRMVGLDNLDDARRTFIADYFDSCQRERLDGELMPEIDHMGSWTGEFSFRHFRTAAAIPVHWTVFRLPQTNADSPGHFACVARDITQQKQSDLELRSASNLLRAVADGTPDAVFVKDKLGRYLLCNPATAQFVGRSADEVLGRDDTAIFGPDDARLIMERDRRVMATGKIETEEEALTADGVTRIFLAMKAPYYDGDGNIAGVIGVSRDITERKQSEELIRFRDRAMQAVTQGIIITDPLMPDNPIIYASPSVQRLTGYSPAEIVGRNLHFLQGAETDPEAVAKIRDAVSARRPCTVELLNYCKDGTPFWNELSISPVMDSDGRLIQFVGVLTDVTERHELEEQYRHSQKLEAIGQLAGGVAHDFNNLLTIITGYSELLLNSLTDDDPSRDALIEISKAGERSATLTRQLLTFSRRQVTTPTVVDLNEVVRDADKMLRRMIGEDITLETHLAPGLALVKADVGQLHQVLLNLALNSRDAMPQGGLLNIRTGVVEIASGCNAEHPGVPPGSYITLVVTDNGEGMDDETLRRLFEPYFTTKEPGKGTGLGLSVVHGAVKQSEGFISVSSQLRGGASFHIYLPRVEQPAWFGRPLGASQSAPGGAETVLLVEDEEALRSLSGNVLRICGYKVIEACNGEDALEIVQQQPVDLLLTDVVMPGMGGRVLAERLLEKWPNLKVLYMSGYTDDAIVRHGVARNEVAFLQKPYLPNALGHKVREVLDSSGRQGVLRRNEGAGLQ